MIRTTNAVLYATAGELEQLHKLGLLDPEVCRHGCQLEHREPALHPRPGSDVELRIRQAMALTLSETEEVVEMATG